MKTKLNYKAAMAREKISRRRYDSKKNGIAFALLLIVAGVVFLLFNTGVIPAIYKPVIFSWQALLIVLGVWSLFKKRFFSGAILILIGAVFMQSRLAVIFPELFVSGMDVYWPVLLIVVGIMIVLRLIFRRSGNSGVRGHRNSRVYDKNVESQTGDYLDKNTLFNSSEQIVLSQNFKGGEINTMFGEFVLDLRKAASVERNIFIELNVMFGNITVFVPTDWGVVVDGDTMFGSIDDNRTVDNISEDSEKPILTIKGGCMFASIEIRN